MRHRRAARHPRHESVDGQHRQELLRFGSRPGHRTDTRDRPGTGVSPRRRNLPRHPARDPSHRGGECSGARQHPERPADREESRWAGPQGAPHQSGCGARQHQPAPVPGGSARRDGTVDPNSPGVLPDLAVADPPHEPAQHLLQPTVRHLHGGSRIGHPRRRAVLERSRGHTWQAREGVGERPTPHQHPDLRERPVRDPRKKRLGDAARGGR